MAIVTVTGTPDKGETLTYTLDKAELVAHAKVAADSYFNNQANWKRVSLVMRSNVGGQSKILILDTGLASPSAELVTTSFSRNAFLIDRLTIFDKEGGQLLLVRSDLNSSEFDVVLESVPEAQSVAFTGTEEVGETLTGSYVFFDDDGDTEGVSTYQWYRADDGIGTGEAAIAGATSLTYLVDALDETKFLRLGVIPVAAAGENPGVEAFSSYSAEITLAVNFDQISVSGTAYDGVYNLAYRPGSILVGDEITAATSRRFNIFERDNTGVDGFWYAIIAYNSATGDAQNTAQYIITREANGTDFTHFSNGGSYPTLHDLGVIGRVTAATSTTQYGVFDSPDVDATIELSY